MYLLPHPTKKKKEDPQIERPWFDRFVCYRFRYATDEKAFFEDFSKAFAKLIELGVPEENFAGKAPFTLKTLDEQGIQVA